MDPQTRKTMTTSGNPERETPQWFYDLLDGEFHFTTDCAATEKNALADRYIDAKLDAFETDWDGVCFVNPPYGRGMQHWADRMVQQINLNDRCKLIVALIAARTDTRWFATLAARAIETRFIAGRLTFTLNGKPTDPAPFPSAVAILSKEKPPQYVSDLRPFRAGLWFLGPKTLGGAKMVKNGATRQQG